MLRQGRGSNVGIYFWIRDWRGDEAVSACGYAAKGLWIDMLFVMVQQELPGVLPGDLRELARLMGHRGRDVGRAWVASVSPLVAELEAEGVFTRGKDLARKPWHPAVADDAIVNRRMWREHCLKLSKKLAGKAGGKLSARGRKRAEDGTWLPSSGPSSHPSRHPSSDPSSDPSGGELSTKQAGSASRTAEGGCAVESKQVENSVQAAIQHSSTSYSYSTKDQERTPGIRPRNEAAGEGHPDTVELYARLVSQATGDLSFLTGGHRRRIGRILERAGGERALDDLLSRVDSGKDARTALARGEDVVRDAARFVSAELVRLEGE